MNVVANTEKFSRGMKNARKELSSFQTAIASAKRAFVGFGAVFAAGFSINAIRDTISEIDNLADAADRLGTSVKSLAGLTHAAFMSDVSSESLNRALTMMERNVAKNSVAFRALGLDARQLKSLDAATMFTKIADAINSMPTAAERTAAAMAVFGKSGVQLLELISKGGAGIQSAMDQAGVMGLTPSDAEVEKIRDADEAIKLLTQSYKALKMELAIELAPVLKQTTEWLSSPTGQHGVNKLKEVKSTWENIDAAMQKRVDDMAVGMGIQSTHDTREFREFAEGLKQKRHEEFERWRANTKETLAILEGTRRWRPAGTGKFNIRDKEGWPLDMSGFKSAPSSSPLGGGSLLFNQIMLNMMARMAPQGAPGTSEADISRVASQIAGMDIAGNAPRDRRRFAETSFSSLSALEKGSAAAFSQERMGRREGQLLDINKQQLTENKKQTAALQRIDTNLKNASFATEAANLG